MGVEPFISMEPSLKFIEVRKLCLIMFSLVFECGYSTRLYGILYNLESIVDSINIL